MNFNVIAVESFEKHLKRLSKKYNSLKTEIEQLSTSLENNPLQGEPLGKDCYKIRIYIASKGKGKQGGGRVVTCVKIVAGIVFLLALYDKSEKDNISDTELDILLKLAGII